MSSLLDALRLAFGLLTAVPVGGLPPVDRRSAGRAMVLAPVTTVPMLAVLAGAHLLVTHTALPSLLVAALVLAVEAMVTRALHLDGLADTADGFSAGPAPADRLRAMKASDIGPSGVVALVLVLLVQATALAALLPSVDGLRLCALSWITSRLALVVACRSRVPSAADTGLGALVAGSVSPTALAVALVCGFVVAGLVALSTWAALAVFAGALAAAALVVRSSRRLLGGVSGDVLGAVVEVALVTGLVLATLRVI